MGNGKKTRAREIVYPGRGRRLQHYYLLRKPNGIVIIQLGNRALSLLNPVRDFERGLTSTGTSHRRGLVMNNLDANTGVCEWIDSHAGYKMQNARRTFGELTPSVPSCSPALQGGYNHEISTYKTV